MSTLRKKIVIDEQGNPKEVIISWAQFCELAQTLGLDLDLKAKADLRATKADIKCGRKSAFQPPDLRRL